MAVEWDMRDNRNITNILFRDKTKGWKRYDISMTVKQETAVIQHAEPFEKNLYGKAFIENIFFRSSCYRCPVKPFKSGSDITIGDYWGIGNVLPDFDDDRGVSLVMVNTGKGRALYESIQGLECRETSYAAALAGNRSIECSMPPNPRRGAFFREFARGGAVSDLVEKLTRETILRRLRRLAGAALRRLRLCGGKA